MAKKSAGVMMYRYRDSGLEILLVHPGGPYWAGKDEGVWSIPKGEYSDDEEPLEAARREFREETGSEAEGDFIPLSPVKQPGGKLVSAWAIEGDCDEKKITSNNFAMEWPPGSGRQSEFPEVDRAGWFPVSAARKKILKGQAGFIEELIEKLRHPVEQSMEPDN